MFCRFISTEEELLTQLLSLSRCAVWFSNIIIHSYNAIISLYAKVLAPPPEPAMPAEGRSYVLRLVTLLLRTAVIDVRDRN